MKECTTYPKFSAGVKSSILLTYWTIFLLLLKKPFPYPRLPCSIWIFFMTSHVHFQITIGYKWISADWTLKWFQFLVHGHNMVMQSFLVKETFFAFITLKWFELQMNILDVTFQTRSRNTHHSTLITLIFGLSFSSMSPFYMHPKASCKVEHLSTLLTLLTFRFMFFFVMIF